MSNTYGRVLVLGEDRGDGGALVGVGGHQALVQILAEDRGEVVHVLEHNEQNVASTNWLVGKQASEQVDSTVSYEYCLIF